MIFGKPFITLNMNKITVRTELNKLEWKSYGNV